MISELKKYISILIIFSIASVIYAQDVRPVNNFDRIEKDMPFISDRYGRDKKSGKKKADSFKYFIRSFLVPGWGEYKLGRKKEAAGFIITEISLIAVAAGFKYYSVIREDDYKDLAVMQAGVNPAGKDERYWVDIANYDNVEDYNAQRNVDRDFTNRYDDPSEFWDWSSTSVRKDYDDIRISSEDGNTRFYYTIGAIALNHLVSAINASYRAPALKTEIVQTVDDTGELKHKLTLSYNFR